MEYRKLDVSIKDRIVFLFTSLLPKDCLMIERSDNSIYQVKQEKKVSINNIEEVKEESSDLKMDNIPFFDLDNSETKSNL